MILTRLWWWREGVAEAAGTFLLVFFGTGAVFVAALLGGLSGLLQVALVWGAVVALAVYAVGAISGAHLNPTVTIALAAWRKFAWGKVPLYLAAQLAGAVLAAALLLALFQGVLRDFEAKNRLVRGAAGSERSAMVFGEYFPNSAMIGTDAAARATISTAQAMLAEAAGAALLVFFIFALTDPRIAHRPHGALLGLCIGLGLAIIIVILAPLTQAGFNPARDLGPRLVSYLAGWGMIAFPGPRGGFFTVYILAPIVGGLGGGGVYELLLRPLLPDPAASDS